MAEYRPYRVANRTAQARLAQVKLISLSSFAAAALLINWWVTERAARMLGHAPALGAALLGGIYAPWEWIAWWTRWHGVTQLQPVWDLCAREAALPLLVAAAIAAGAINLARWWLNDSTPDLHGSARWENTRDVRATGFLAPPSYLPRWLRRRLERAGKLKPLPPRDGIYLGAWRIHGRLHYLRDCGPGHVLIEAPTRAGKGVNTMVPTLLTWRHSALVHDFKEELWEVTAGARKRMGHLCFRFNPTNPDDPGVKYNPLEEVRLRTPYETADVQNIVQMLVDPDGRGFGNDNYWVAAGMALLTGAILHILYLEPAKTLRGLVGLLSDPSSPIDATINRMMTAEHDPTGAMGWRTSRGQPTRTHPSVAESMREVLNKAEKERSGVVGEVVRRLPLYRDPLIAAATEYSDFRIDDLVNHERPASLYLNVPHEHRNRLRPLMRLMINQIVGRLTAKLAYKDGRPVSPHRRPMLLMLDEFALLQHFEPFAEAMSHMAGFGVRACLAVQTLNQIYKFYGPNESITDNCDSVIRFTPNSLDSAEGISRLVGQTSVRHAHRTQSGGAPSVSEQETGRPLMTPDESRCMAVDEVLIFARGQHPIRAPLLSYHKQRYFRRLSAIKPPASDRIERDTEPEAKAVARVEPQSQDAAEPVQAMLAPTVIAAKEPAAQSQHGEQLSFLRFAIENNNGSDDTASREDAKERLL
jgi:type IV secretion system protein VirD4